jgi:hypothetical protein
VSGKSDECVGGRLQLPAKMMISTLPLHRLQQYQPDVGRRIPAQARTNRATSDIAINDGTEAMTAKTIDVWFIEVACATPTYHLHPTDFGLDLYTHAGSHANTHTLLTASPERLHHLYDFSRRWMGFRMFAWLVSTMQPFITISAENRISHTNHEDFRGRERMQLRADTYTR